MITFNDVPVLPICNNEREYKNRVAALAAIRSFMRMGFNFIWVSPRGDSYFVRWGIVPGEVTREFIYTFLLDKVDREYIESKLKGVK